MFYFLGQDRRCVLILQVSSLKLLLLVYPLLVLLVAHLPNVSQLHKLSLRFDRFSQHNYIFRQHAVLSIPPLLELVADVADDVGRDDDGDDNDADDEHHHLHVHHFLLGSLFSLPLLKEQSEVWPLRFFRALFMIISQEKFHL